ncbi:hypothetical protein [Neopusillimonas aromaticivorans]|uniref:hypothetical protein n=1 Tax=Neopusillimonas aromaticivorans TaxID=2979868 RepID=UPI002594E0DE|nr:hypothetical protein [Neopusillimonas aromaticivorans]WJJ94007.1 hypothetical protein N7E01_02170 [Neopusillimonas aromaticivorans]
MLNDFALEGDLSLVERIGQDVQELAAILADIHRRGLFPEQNAIGLDQIGINFEESFAEAEIPDELLTGISQGTAWAARSRPLSASWLKARSFTVVGP